MVIEAFNSSDINSDGVRAEIIAEQNQGPRKQAELYTYERWKCR